MSDRHFAISSWDIPVCESDLAMQYMVFLYYYDPRFSDFIDGLIMDNQNKKETTYTENGSLIEVICA
ncbi:MAG: hypothetical protein V2I33_06805 [Kangiellaceae bacterium]|jgi:hypothetical protein|nr:hypothetical protein [Kangiellaceae bacterium]